MNASDRDDLDRFAQEMMEEIGENPNGPDGLRVLSGARDTLNGITIYMMAVPPSALADGVGPELWATATEKKFYAALSENVLFAKAEEINNIYPEVDAEEKNHLMSNFIAAYMPELFERALLMKPLDL
jgi:hypothetical protein